MNTKYSFSLLALILFIIDRLSKYLALDYLSEGFFCCQNWLGLKIFFNEGIAFGYPMPVIVSLVLSFIIIIALGAAVIKNYHNYTAIIILSIALIIIGAVSNLLDRLYFGQVIDFINIGPWPVFNLSDIFIMIGVGTIIVIKLKK